MAAQPNILFIMADQLRADYLGCGGHPAIETPNIDALALDGVMFDRAYTQGPVCGPSRASFYTGRYVINHGATYNNIPLRVGEWTLGDHLRPLGYRVAVAGKTHSRPDLEGMKRLGIDPTSPLGELTSNCGFEPFARDEGLHPDQSLDPDLPYNAWLRSLGYAGRNPWHDFANSAEGPDGEVLSGWYLRNATLPARVAEEHAETPYMTERAMAFIEEAGAPWCLHLSYIKPHWPYIAAAPYHQMYGIEDILPANRDPKERDGENPVVGAFRRHEESVSFSRDEVRSAVIPTYMGLISQLDRHLGRLFDFLKQRGLWDDTLIVFTSDHGDYLGDHWLGEKDLFHEEIARLPLIVRDPSPAADATRGTRSERLVEAIDLVPTFVEAGGGEDLDHVLEGRSLLPLLRGEAPTGWREAVFSECDYAIRSARNHLGVGPDECHCFMVRTADWKLNVYNGFGAELFDLSNDPGELDDLGDDPGHAAIQGELHLVLEDWLRQRRTRITLTNAQVAARTGSARERGYIFGAW